MPPRLAVIAIVLGWLATIGWVASDKWMHHFRPNDRPDLLIELADEVAPEMASWTVSRGGKKIGTADTRFAPRKDGLFEMSSKIRELDTRVAIIEVKIPFFTTTRVVNRQGEVVSIEANGKLTFKVLGLELKIDGTFAGTVEGDEVVGECTFASEMLGAGKTTHKIVPIPMKSKQAFSPLQPMHKFPPLRPGQTWTESNVDPVSDVLSAALEQVAKKWLAETLPGQSIPNLFKNKAAARELRAEVQTETEPIPYRGNDRICRVIVYKGEDLRMRTWVDIVDGRVLKQEATSLGEKLILQRE
jgi:hypothetical protein